MTPRRLAALLLIAAGLLALALRTFEVPGTKRQAEIGPLKLSLQKSERVTVPTWVGVTLVSGGVVLLLLKR